MTDQHRGQRDDQEFIALDRQFNRRWRGLVDRAGGQKVLVNRLDGWTKSTVSRDYTGVTLPTDERLRQLCAFLKAGRAEQDELRGLLEQARSARQARKQDLGSARPADAGPAQAAHPDAARRRLRGHGRVAVLLGAGALAGVMAAAVAVSVWQPWTGAAQPGGGAADTASVTVARGSYPGIGIKAVTISVKSLTPALAGAFGHGQTSGDVSVHGYVFRNMLNTGLCLTAADTGPAAGRNGDRVEIAACDGAPSQVWIPEQWQINGTRFTHLVSYRYQSMCLNARNLGGLHNGQKTQLWNCYPAANESWDFGDWFRNAQAVKQAYPIFVESARLCLDADKYDYRDGDVVNLWDQYPAANQFWS